MSPLPRRAPRALYGIALSVTLSALGACNTRSLEAPALQPSQTTTNGYQETLNQKRTTPQPLGRREAALAALICGKCSGY